MKVNVLSTHPFSNTWNSYQQEVLPTLSAVVSALLFTFSLKRQCNAILYLGSNDALQAAFGGHPKAGEQAKGAAWVQGWHPRTPPPCIRARVIQFFLTSFTKVSKLHTQAQSFPNLFTNIHLKTFLPCSVSTPVWTKKRGWGSRQCQRDQWTERPHPSPTRTLEASQPPQAYSLVCQMHRLDQIILKSLQAEALMDMMTTARSNLQNKPKSR